MALRLAASSLALAMLASCAPATPQQAPNAAPPAPTQQPPNPAPPAPAQQAPPISQAPPAPTQQAPASVSAPAAPPAPTQAPPLTQAPPSAATIPPRATAAPRVPLADAVHAAIDRHAGAGTIGVVVTRLGSGETVSVNADRRFRSASLYKLFVLDAAMTELAAGRLDAADTLTVTSDLEQFDPYLDLDVGARISVDCALQTMIEMSGNAAADLLLQRLGLPLIARQINALGLTQSAITDDSAFTSPADVASVLERVARGELVSAAASQRMLDLLSAQQHNDRIPAPLPLGVRIAHKTGELPSLRHDAAIVYAPSGPYVLVTMVQDAPSEAAARAAIVDISAAVYAALEPTPGLAFEGLPPRLARQVLATPDARGRLPLLGDPRTETARLPADLRVATDADPLLRVRPEIVDDLVAMQTAAEDADTPFWVRDGFRQPTDAEAGKTLPTEWIMPCAVEQPALVADRRVVPAEVAAAEPHQAWLGTVVALSDRPAGGPTSPDDAASTAGRWLAAHAAEYGFVPALAETATGRGLGREPWAWRWVGHEFAARLAPSTADATYSSKALDQLQRAQTELAAQDAAARRPPLWGLLDSCWTVATSSGRGCPSRWYFLPIPWT